MFKNHLNPAMVVLSCSCLLFLFIGCQSTTSQNIEAVPPTGTIFNTQESGLPNSTRSVTQTATETWTPIPTVTETWTPIPTSVESPISPPTPTLLPTELATPTPWPTLSPNEAADKVLSLLADNQNPNCLLPCWWGAIPGQTQWQDVEPFLRSFTKVNDSSSETSLGASVTLPLPESIAVSSSGDYYVFYSWDKSGVIQGIVIDSINISGYNPYTMMTLYGVPDEVWLKTFPDLLPGEVLPFRLLLVYQEKGISLRYYVDAVKTGETITACFEPGIVEVARPDLFPAGPRIYLWEPGEQKTIDEILNIPDETYFPLEEKTDLTPQTLFEKFTNPDELPCIDTPAEQWIDP